MNEVVDVNFDIADVNGDVGDVMNDILDVNGEVGDAMNDVLDPNGDVGDVIAGNKKKPHHCGFSFLAKELAADYAALASGCGSGCAA